MAGKLGQARRVRGLKGKCFRKETISIHSVLTRLALKA